MKIRLKLLFLSILLLSLTARGQGLNLLHGQLKNKLNYYIIQQDSTKPNIIEVRLVMPIGSFNEDISKPSGIAHFLEHLAFDGSKDFPNDNMKNFVENCGSTFGNGINAVTGYDRTIFQLKLPCNKKSTLDSCILLASNWLHKLHLDSVSVEKERKIITEELRCHKENDPFYRIKIGCGEKVKHNPLGSYNDIQNINRDDVYSFYKKWYHPQLAYLIISSKYPQDTVLQYIKNNFNFIPKTNISRPQQTGLSYPKNNLSYNSIIDSTLNKNSLEFIIPYNRRGTNNISEGVNRCLYSIISKIIQNNVCKGLNANSYNNWYLIHTYHLGFILNDKNRDSLLYNLSIIHNRLNYIKKYGLDFISNSTWNIYKQNEIKNLQIATNDNIVNYLIDNIIEGDFIIKDSTEYKKIIKKVNHLSIKQANRLIKKILNSNYKPLICYNGKQNLEQEKIENIINNNKCIEPPYCNVKIDTTVEKKRVKKLNNEKNIILPYKGKVLKNNNIDIYYYKNGITLIYKKIQKTANDEDTYIQIYSPNGLTNINKCDINRLQDTPAYIDMGSITGFNDSTWNNILQDNEIAMNSMMENFNHGYRLKCPTKNIDNLLYIIKLKMTEPHIPRQSFKECINEQIKEYNNIGSDIEKYLQNANNKEVTDFFDKYLGKKINITETKIEDLKKMSAQEIEDFYKNMYSSTKGTMIFICTTASADSVLYSFGKSLAHLPYHQYYCKQNPNDYYSDNIYFTDHPIIENNNKLDSTTSKLKLTDSVNTNNPTSNEAITVNNLYCGNFEISLKNIIVLKILRQLLFNEMLNNLRLKNGIVYSPYVWLDYVNKPQSRYIIQLENTINTRNYNKLQNIINQTIENLYKKGISDKDLDNIKKTFLANKSNALNGEDVSNWLKVFNDCCQLGYSIEDFDNYDDILNKITTKDIKEKLKEYIIDCRVKKIIKY